MSQAVEYPQWDEIGNTLKTILNYDYASTKVPLRNLYEKAKREQWNASEDIDWGIEVDVERGILNDRRVAIYGTPLWDSLDEKQRRRLNYLESAWSLSQFLHGEQGSLLVCGQLVDCVPHLDAKFYAASQAFDEARHVEVFERYLVEKLGGIRPINKDLKFLLDVTLSSELWQMKCIGMQTHRPADRPRSTVV
ncbi:MAG: ferritin-like domain-containing protein [Acidobacteria bacterium]|nr:ferritin-like domain-containing protein [Acidobacteriota bacterium]